MDWCKTETGEYINMDKLVNIRLRNDPRGELKWIVAGLWWDGGRFIEIKRCKEEQDAWLYLYSLEDSLLKKGWIKVGEDGLANLFTLVDISTRIKDNAYSVIGLFGDGSYHIVLKHGDKAEIDRFIPELEKKLSARPL